MAVGPLLLLAGGVQAGASILNGISANRAARATAQRLSNDANTAELVGGQQAENRLEQARRDEGAFVAQAGASGFGVDGTIFDGLAAIRRQAATDESVIRYEAMRQATELRAQAGETRASGRASLISGAVGAGGTLLSTAANVKRVGGL